MTPAVRTPAVRARGAGVVLDGRPALHDVSFSVLPGELVAILGGNGCGKTTLVRALLGLVPLATGVVELYGVPVQRFREHRRIGYVPQRLSAGAGVPASLREVVAAGLAPRGPRLFSGGASARDRVLAALAAVGLADRAGDRVESLSGGQQQRVLIARALVRDPDLFVLDEPVAGVDTDSQEHFAQLLARLVAAGRTVLLVAHELGPIEPLVRRALVLESGRLVSDGTPPRALGHHAAPGHDHVHPHPPDPQTAPAIPWQLG